MTKLILEYISDGQKQRMAIHSCAYHRIDKCAYNNRICEYPKLDVPEHCHMIGKIVSDGVITRGQA